MSKNKLIGILMLFICSLIWGVTFVAQSEGAEHIAPMWFICIRNVLGFIVLLPVVAAANIKRAKNQSTKKFSKKEKLSFIFGSMACGFSLCAASYCQQLGITMGTPSGKAAFVTALYIVLVPIAYILFKRKVRTNVWIGAVISVFGLYLLCMSGKSEFKASDLVILLSALLFTAQIIIIDFVSPHFDGVKLSAMQFFFCSIFAFCYAAAFEKITFADIKAGIIPLLYAGILASGIAYTFQITGQKRLANPTVATMIMSMESVFGAISGAVILGQKMTLREVFGCALMFAAIVLAQLPIEEIIQKRRSKHERA